MPGRMFELHNKFDLLLLIKLIIIIPKLLAFTLRKLLIVWSGRMGFRSSLVVTVPVHDLPGT